MSSCYVPKILAQFLPNLDLWMDLFKSLRQKFHEKSVQCSQADKSGQTDRRKDTMKLIRALKYLCESFKKKCKELGPSNHTGCD